MWQTLRRDDNDDPFAEFDGRTSRRRPTYYDQDVPLSGLLGMSMMAGESVGRRLATAIANWNNDPRRFVRLALMMYLVLSMFVLISALHAANPRMPLISWLGLFALFFLVSFRIAQVLVYYRRLAALGDQGFHNFNLRHSAGSNAMRSRRGVGGGGGMLMELNNEVVGISPEQRRLMTRELTANDYDTLLALDDDSEVRRGGDGRGGDEAVIDRLPSYRVACGAKELTCSICLDPLAIGDEARILPCLHQFHKACVDKWLRYLTRKNYPSFHL